MVLTLKWSGIPGCWRLCLQSRPSRSTSGWSLAASSWGRNSAIIWATTASADIESGFWRRLFGSSKAIHKFSLIPNQVLKYDPFGHYAPHFDHLQPMPASYDEGWFVFFGNRLATALLLVETASLGGFTTFPQLELTISPEKGNRENKWMLDSLEPRWFVALVQCGLQWSQGRASFTRSLSNFGGPENCGLTLDSWQFSGKSASDSMLIRMFRIAWVAH